MKITLDLPDELIREVKVRAVVQRRTVKDLVAECLRQGLGVAPAVKAAKLAADLWIEKSKIAK
jgi:plasmid stability protein